MSGKFDLKDYVDVKERIRQFYERYPDGRLVTEQALPSTEPDGTPRIWVKARAYRTADDPLPTAGWSWLELPGSTPYTRGSEIENAETSAWGRAIGALGIGIAAGIASRDEVEAKADQGGVGIPLGVMPPEPAKPESMMGAGGSLIGTVEARKPPADLELRIGRFDDDPPSVGPRPMIGFGLVGPKGRGHVQVMAEGELAQALVPLLPTLEGQRATVWGEVRFVNWKREGKPMRPYQRLILSRIETADWTLPAPAPVQAEDDDLADLDFPDRLPMPEPDMDGGAG